MNIKKTDTNHWEIKNKKSTIFLNEAVAIDEFIIPGPGEYEVAGIEADVFSGVYCIDMDDMMIVYLSKDKKDLSADERKKIAECDILFIPVAGADTMKVKDALSIISDIEPAIVIPIYYDNLAEFTKSEGIDVKEVEELKINKEDISSDQRQVVILK